jgi:hypothetical protein
MLFQVRVDPTSRLGRNRIMLRRLSTETARLGLELDGAENKIRFLEAYNKERSRQFISLTPLQQGLTMYMLYGLRGLVPLPFGAVRSQMLSSDSQPDITCLDKSP